MWGFCTVCGRGGYVERHHRRYRESPSMELPSDIEFLCGIHHRAEHPHRTMDIHRRDRGRF